MITVKYIIYKRNVYLEVQKTTHYNGDKAVGEEEGAAFDRIALKQADMPMLERYWGEACAVATECMRQFIVSTTSQLGGMTNVTNDVELHDDGSTYDYEVTLELPANFNQALSDAISSSLYSFFVNYIIAKWDMSVNKSEVSTYMTEASEKLADVRSKLYYRKRPTYTPPTVEPDTPSVATTTDNS